MKVRNLRSGLVYIALLVPGGYKFTLNDGRVIGAWAMLPEEEFWQTFERTSVACL